MKQNVTADDFRMKIIPIEYLSRAKEERLRFLETIDLSSYAKRIYTDDCMLDIPELPFEPVSIIVILAKMSMKTAVFHYGGKSITDLFRVREISVDDYLNSLFSEKGYHFMNARKLPQKALAVCSGLGKYGKNNLVYEEDWGSFIQLETYISDVPYDPDCTWRDVVNMEHCDSCGTCARLCPGQAIPKDRFLLNMENCHGFLDIMGKLPESAPHFIASCFVCQKNCPKNKEWRSNVETVEFSEEETALLMTAHEMPGNPFRLNPGEMNDLMRGWGYPESLVSKITKLGIYPWTLKDMPAKLEHMFAHTL